MKRLVMQASKGDAEAFIRLMEDNCDCKKL